MTWSRRRREQSTSTPIEWWTEPTPACCDKLLRRAGLRVLTGNDVVDLAELLRAPSELHERERMVLQLRFGLDRGGVPRTVPEITEEVGVAESRISQVLESALAKVRDHYVTRLT